MTPAIVAARNAGIKFEVHEYTHDPRAASYGTEAAERLGLSEKRVFKTLLVALDGDNRNLAVGIIPVAAQLDLKAIAAACKCKKLRMADPAAAQRSTGYLLGGISPLGQKRRLPTKLDISALGFQTIYVSAGRRGLEIELAPQDLLELTSGQAQSIIK